MASSQRATDKILAQCCQCPLKALVETQESVLSLIDAETTPGFMVDKYRELARLIDGIGAFRFPRDWDTVSPAQRRDAALMRM